MRVYAIIAVVGITVVFGVAHGFLMIRNTMTGRHLIARIRDRIRTVVN
jgi:hypothetical protein